MGTNSLGIPLPGGKMAPSPAVLLRSGPYEITAFVLLAAALAGLARYRIVGPWWSFRSRWEPIAPEGLRPRERLAAALAVALLLASNAWEAWQVVLRGGPRP